MLGREESHKVCQRGPWAALAALVLGALAHAAGQADDPRAFVEAEVERETWYAGEPIRVVLRLGFETELFDQGLIQPFQRRLDVPAQVQADWIATPRGDPETQAAAPTLAVGDGVATVRSVEDRTVDGRSFRVFELDQVIEPGQPGELLLEGPRLRYAHATRFREDLVLGRVPEDRRDAVVRGEGLALRVAALPDEGRPASFGGGIGSFRMSVSGEPRTLAPGDSLKVNLSLEGTGNLDRLQPPPLDDLEGFHLLGRLETPGPGRTFVYDLTPTRPVRSLPAIRYSYYEPGATPGYRTLESEPIPLTWTGAAAEPVPSGEGEPGGAPWAPVVGGTVGVLLVLVFALRRRRGSS